MIVHDFSKVQPFKCNNYFEKEKGKHFYKVNT
jgi:hypothetical protein